MCQVPREGYGSDRASHFGLESLCIIESHNHNWVLTRFWHFDFSAYLKYGTYGIMGSYRTFMHYVRSFIKKNAYWGHTAKNSGQKWDFAILGNSWVRVLPVWLFWIRARIRAAVQDSCSEHISDRKDTFGKFINSTPPIWDLSRESWDARSEP